MAAVIYSPAELLQLLDTPSKPAFSSAFALRVARSFDAHQAGLSGAANGLRHPRHAAQSHGERWFCARPLTLNRPYVRALAANLPDGKC